jgi:hypothetical protein
VSSYKFVAIFLTLALFGAVVASYHFTREALKLIWYLCTILIGIPIRYGWFLLLYILIVVVLISISVAAYQLRSKHRIVYGLIETMFGIMTIIYTVSQVLVNPYLSGKAPIAEDVGSTLIVQLVAGMYIIVRGLTNVEDGLAKGKLSFFDMLLEGVHWSGFFLRSHGIPTSPRRSVKKS